MHERPISPRMKPAQRSGERSVIPTVLVVDDDPDLTSFARVILAAEGYEVTTAANGRQALEVIRTGRMPALILLDLMMPVMDGYQFRLRQLSDIEIAAIPVVLMTAWPNPPALDRLRLDAVLSKPLRVEQLLVAVARFCPRVGGGRGGERATSA